MSCMCIAPPAKSEAWYNDPWELVRCTFCLSPSLCVTVSTIRTSACGHSFGPCAHGKLQRGVHTRCPQLLEQFSSIRRGPEPAACMLTSTSHMQSECPYSHARLIGQSPLGHVSKHVRHVTTVASMAQVPQRAAVQECLRHVRACQGHAAVHRGVCCSVL